MNQPHTSPAESELRLARQAVVVICVAMILYGVGILFLRAMLPAQLGIFEGKTLSAAVDFSHGTKIYRDPTQHGAADIYTPLYPMLLGLLHRVAAPSLMWGRLLTFLFSAVTCGAIAAYFARRTERRALVALVLTALYVSITWKTEWFFSALKSDVMCHMLWLCGLAVLLRRGVGYAGLSAVLIVLAFFSKQTAVFAIPGAMLFLLFVSRRDLIAFVVSLVVGYAAVFYALTAIAGDWMAFYIFGRMQIQAGHEISIATLMRFAFSLRTSPATLALAALAIGMCRQLWPEPAYRLAFFSAPFLLAGSVLTASSEGGGYNSLIPGLTGLVFLSGFGALKVVRLLDTRASVGWMAAALLLFQWDAATPYNISKARGKMDQDFIQAVDFLSEQEGTMYCPSHPVITLLAGHRNNDDRILAEYIRPNEPKAYDRVVASMNSAQFDWLILDRHEEDLELIRPDVLARYDEPRDFDSWLVFKKLAAP